MSIFNSFDICASGMTSQRFRTDIITQNIANANTTRTENGEAYRRKVVTFAEKNNTPFSLVLARTGADMTGSGVNVTRVSQDYETEMVRAYDPSHPDADENGYVTYPNVNIITEMTNLIDATRAYEANATAFESSKAIVTKGLSLGQ